jgi:hypothetical protein
VTQFNQLVPRALPWRAEEIQMILRFQHINGIGANIETGAMAFDVSGSCTERQLLDNIAVLWERVEDERLIAYLRTCGYELRKLAE